MLFSDIKILLFSYFLTDEAVALRALTLLVRCHKGHVAHEKILSLAIIAPSLSSCCHKEPDHRLKVSMVKTVHL